MCEIGVSTLEEALARAEELFQKKANAKSKPKYMQTKKLANTLFAIMFINIYAYERS